MQRMITRPTAFGALIWGICLSLAGPAIAHDEFEPGFLRFTASTTLKKGSKAVDVRVGLFASNGKVLSDKVWFYGRFADRLWTAPSDFRWTDSERCPAAMSALRRVRAISMPHAVLPIPDPEGFERQEPDIIVDGRLYTLDVQSSNLDGQMTSEIHMSSNIGTELAKWTEDMLAALKSCWSKTVPDGVSAQAGSKWDAEANPR